MVENLQKLQGFCPECGDGPVFVTAAGDGFHAKCALCGRISCEAKTELDVVQLSKQDLLD